MNDPRVIEVSESQAKSILRATWSVAAKKVGEKWFIYLMLLGGKEEKIVRKLLNQ